MWFPSEFAAAAVGQSGRLLSVWASLHPRERSVRKAASGPQTAREIDAPAERVRHQVSAIPGMKRAPALPQRGSVDRQGGSARPPSLGADAVVLQEQLSSLQAEHAKLRTDFQVLSAGVLKQKKQAIRDLPEQQSAPARRFSDRSESGSRDSVPSTSAAWTSLGSLWSIGSSHTSSSGSSDATIASLKKTCEAMATALGDSQTRESEGAATIAELEAKCDALRQEVSARNETIEALHRKLEEKAEEVAQQIEAEHVLTRAAKQQVPAAAAGACLLATMVSLTMRDVDRLSN